MEMSRQLLLAVSGVYVRRSCPSVFSLLWREGGWRGEAAASHDPAHVAGGWAAAGTGRVNMPSVGTRSNAASHT